MTLSNIVLTKREYDALRIINKLSAGVWPVSLKKISEEIGVKPPTALEFINRIKKENLVVKGVGGYRITEAGKKFVENVVRKHRIFESILVCHGISIDSACKCATKMELLIDNEIVDAAFESLGHPHTCPHGLKIPQGDLDD